MLPYWVPFPIWDISYISFTALCFSLFFSFSLVYPHARNFEIKHSLNKWFSWLRLFQGNIWDLGYFQISTVTNNAARTIFIHVFDFILLRVRMIWSIWPRAPSWLEIFSSGKATTIYTLGRRIGVSGPFHLPQNTVRL